MPQYAVTKHYKPAAMDAPVYGFARPGRQCCILRKAAMPSLSPVCLSGSFIMEITE
jgi:hypothetical protein